MLRLLSLVVHSLKGANKAYISVADFDLANMEIRQELLKHIGPEYNGVIAMDITDAEAGCSKVDASLGKAYRGLKLGTRTGTAIFLHSFSGGPERGVELGEIKRCSTTAQNPASVVVEAAEQLKSRLFYLQSIGEKYFFTNQPNINRILLTKMENVTADELLDMERKLLTHNIGGARLKVFPWQEDSSNIPDSEELKLVILNKESRETMDHILKTKGQTPRVYRNTLFFLYPLESERTGFEDSIRRKIAYEHIEQDKTLSLTNDQRKEVKKQLKAAETGLKEAIRRLYWMVALPGKDGFKETDLGIPTYGEQRGLDQEVYEKLRSDGEILERIVPLVIKEKYLTDKEHVQTEQLYQSALKTPGETRPTNREVLEEGIAEGVRMGLFGLGDLEEDEPICRYFKEQASVALSGNEVLISEAVSRQQRQEEDVAPPPPPPPPPPAPPPGGRDRVALRFQVPKGKVSSIMGVMNLLQSKFEILEVQLTAERGAITEQDYQDKIEEAFRQLGIKVDEE